MCPGMDGVFYQLLFLLLPQDLAGHLPSTHESKVPPPPHPHTLDKSGMVVHASEVMLAYEYQR